MTAPCRRGAGPGLGLGLLGLHELGPLGLRWLAVDLLWAVGVGLLVGGVMGTATARLVLHLRSRYRSALGLDELLLVGLIAISYGAAATAHDLLDTNEAIERIAGVAVVIGIGALLTVSGIPATFAWLAPLLFLVVRPAAVWIGLWRSGLTGPQVAICAWFGIRGIGSVYYLSFAITHWLDEAIATSLAAVTLSPIAASIIVHGAR